MTLGEALEEIDALRPNDCSREEKLLWLSGAEEALLAEVFSGHEGVPCETFAGYDTSAPPDTPLLAQGPGSREVYLGWLENRIDYWNGDTERYNNSSLMLRAAWTAFARYWNRTHRPLAAARRFR